MIEGLKEKKKIPEEIFIDACEYLLLSCGGGNLVESLSVEAGPWRFHLLELEAGRQ